MKYDEFFTNQRGVFEFPLIYIKNPSDALAVFLVTAPVGTLPVVINYEGHATKVHDLSPSPQVLKRLMAIFQIVIWVTEDCSIEPRNLYDIVESGMFQLGSIYGEEM